ncbi:unnamed protein product [Sphagnum tenellum]
MDKKIGKKEFYLTKGNLVLNQAKLWGMFFKTNKQFFHMDERHDYQFAFMIETDGVGCSILLVRSDLKGKRKNISKRYGSDEKYIDGLEDYSHLQGKNVVELSFHNSRTLDFETFKAYIQKKNEINMKLTPFYEQRIFRKLRLGSFMMRQQTEAKMLNRFEQMFGSPEDTIIGFGDFEAETHMRYKEPVKAKGFGHCSENEDTRCSWSMSSEPVVAVAPVRENVRHSGNVKTPDLGNTIPSYDMVS